MMDALLRDDRLRWDLAQLAANLDQLLPDGLGPALRFRGDEPLSLEGALEQMAGSSAWTGSRSSSTSVGSDGDLADVDLDEVRDLLGRASRRRTSRRSRTWRRGSRRPATSSARASGWSSRRAAAAARARRSSTSCSPSCARTPSAATRLDARARGGERDARRRSRTSSATRSTWTCSGR